MKRTKSMKRTVSNNQRRMMKVLSQQNCINLLNPSANVTTKTLDKKLSTVNLMFLEDVLEDIETQSKKTHHDINKNLHNLKNIQISKEKENEVEFSSSEDDSDDSDIFSEGESLDFGDEMSPRNESFEETEDGICMSPRMSLEEKKKKTTPKNKFLRLDSNKSTRSTRSNRSNKSNKSDGDVNGPENANTKAHSAFTKKRKNASTKAVRLALLEAGPFRQLLKEGVKVIVHYLRKGETRVTRIQRIMIWLDDEDVEQEGSVDDLQDREDYFDVDSSEEEVDFDDDGEEDSKLNLFGFFKLDQNGVLESSTNLSDINEINTVYMGANTSVFRRSLEHLHGNYKSYDRSEHAMRCFSLVGCKSPFDDRACLDIEILPRDKQKPEEIHAACMIAYGIGTSFQVLSNLSNSNMITTEEEEDVEEGQEEEDDEEQDEVADNEEEEARARELRLREEQAPLFDGGRMPSRKLTVNYLMEEVIRNIPSPPADAVAATAVTRMASVTSVNTKGSSS